MGDGHRALGVRPQGQAGNPQESCLLLQAAGVREDAAGLLSEANAVVVPHGLDEADAGVGGEASQQVEVVESLPCPGMDGEDDGK